MKDSGFWGDQGYIELLLRPRSIPHCWISKQVWVNNRRVEYTLNNLNAQNIHYIFIHLSFFIPNGSICLFNLSIKHFFIISLFVIMFNITINFVFAFKSNEKMALFIFSVKGFGLNFKSDQNFT